LKEAFRQMPGDQNPLTRRSHDDFSDERARSTNARDARTRSAARARGHVRELDEVEQAATVALAVLRRALVEAHP